MLPEPFACGGLGDQSVPEDVNPSLDSSRSGLGATGGEEHPACWMKDGGILQGRKDDGYIARSNVAMNVEAGRVSWC